MNRIDDVARTLDTVGLAAWFGGSLMGAVALAGTGAGDDPLAAEHEAWRRWSPVQSAAIGLHLVGAARLALSDSGPASLRRGVRSVAGAKVALTVGAVAATAYASRAGRTVWREHDPSDPGDDQGPDVDPARLRRLRAAQAAVPALTGAMLVAQVHLGAPQRPMEVLRDVAHRIPEAAHRIPEAAGAVRSQVASLTDALPTSVSDVVPDSLPSMPHQVRDLVAR